MSRELTAYLSIFNQFKLNELWPYDQKHVNQVTGGTDRPGEFCYNFSISNDLTQMVNFPTRISDCDSRRLPLLDFILSSDPSICSTMAFSPLGNSIMLLSQFPLTFHQIHKGMSRFIA